MSDLIRGKLCFKGDKGEPGQNGKDGTNGKDAYQIEILEGEILDIPTGESGDTEVAYPTGFTKDNTAIISVITKYTPLTTEQTFWSSGESNVFVSMVGLNANHIAVSITNNSGSTTKAKYKIAIMKIE